MSFDPSDRSQLPFLDRLEASAPFFLEEVRALPDEVFLPLPDAASHTRGRWEVCLLKLDAYADDFPQALLARNRACCPRSWAALADLPDLVVAGFMRLGPGSVVLPHRDHRDDQVLRVHLGLQLPPAEQGHWPEGRARLMDIRQLHEARNSSDRDRITPMLRFPASKGRSRRGHPPVEPGLVPGLGA